MLIGFWVNLHQSGTIRASDTDCDTDSVIVVVLRMLSFDRDTVITAQRLLESYDRKVGEPEKMTNGRCEGEVGFTGEIDLTNG